MWGVGIGFAVCAPLLASCSATFEHHFSEGNADAGDARAPVEDAPTLSDGSASDGMPRADATAEPDAAPRPDVSADGLPPDARSDVGSPDVASDNAPPHDGSSDGTPPPDGPPLDTSGPNDAPRDLDATVDVPPDASGDADAGCTDASACQPDPPRLLAPHSTGFVTSTQPTLKWTAAAKAESYRVEVCNDKACTSGRQSINTTATSARVPTALPLSTTFFWRVTALNGAFSATSRVWPFSTGARSTSVDTSWLGAADFDGDSFRDVALGGDNQVHVYRNTVAGTGLPTAPQLSISGSNGFGTFVSYAGDVNGDGRGDLIVSSLQNDFAKLLLGTANGLATTPQTLGSGTTTMLQYVTGLGDVNGDGYSDLAVGEGTTSFQWRIYYGADTGAVPTGQAFGSCSDAMDTNGDGYVDGCPAGAAGDVNGDGLADIVMCSRSSKTATVFLSGGGTQTIPLPAGETNFGDGCIGVGDTNGDGYGDVMVATQGTDKVFLFLGSAGGIQTTATAIASGPVGTPAQPTQFAAAGDVNGDGFGDVIVGGSGNNGVMVFHGGGGGTLTAGSQFSSLPAGGGYGRSVATVGDANGDGFADIAFAPSTCTGHTIHVHLGGASGVDTGTPFLQWAAPTSNTACLVIAR